MTVCFVYPEPDYNGTSSVENSDEWGQWGHWNARGGDRGSCGHPDATVRSWDSGDTGTTEGETEGHVGILMLQAMSKPGTEPKDGKLNLSGSSDTFVRR